MKTHIISKPLLALALCAGVLFVPLVPAHAQFDGVLFGTLNGNTQGQVKTKPATTPQNVEPAAGSPHLGPTGVASLQQSLITHGYYNGTVDGRMGVETRNALRAYQRGQNIDASGQIDAATLDSLGLGARLGLSAGGTLNP